MNAFIKIKKFTCLSLILLVFSIPTFAGQKAAETDLPTSRTFAAVAQAASDAVVGIST